MQIVPVYQYHLLTVSALLKCVVLHLLPFVLLMKNEIQALLYRGDMLLKEAQLCFDYSAILCAHPNVTNKTPNELTQK